MFAGVGLRNTLYNKLPLQKSPQINVSKRPRVKRLNGVKTTLVKQVVNLNLFFVLSDTNIQSDDFVVGIIADIVQMYGHNLLLAIKNSDALAVHLLFDLFDKF